MKCLAIIGPGLLGGSIALAAKSRGLADRIHLWTRSEEKAHALAQTAEVDLVSTDLSAVVSGADFLVLATPVGVMKAIAEEIVAAGGLAANPVVTDVGSVKGIVAREVAPVLEKAGIAVVPCHPMAGSEQTGWEHADPNLFDDAICFLTPSSATAPDAVVQVENFWRALGCRTSHLEPKEHDLTVARISHSPHIAAAALVLAALEDNPAAGRFSGNGFRDSSRVASGPPEMWTEILMENREAVGRVLENLTGRLGEVLEFLRNMDDEQLRRFLEAAKEMRDRSLNQPDPGR